MNCPLCIAILLRYQQKRELWERWKSGQTLSEIGRALKKHAGSVHGVLAATGGFEPRMRKRSARVLQLSEREEISRGLGQSFSIRHIAELIRRAPSTISREIIRNGGRRTYRAVQADQRASSQSRRPKPCQLAGNQALRDLVAQKLSQEWSPVQISGWLRVEYSFAQKSEWNPKRICQVIEKVAKEHNLPRATFTRLIWTESRFDIRALSPKGAQGIAQFMPETAKSRGLADPYDPAQALPASASLLADLTKAFGNFGLAAMAYNAGPGRVDRWLKGTSRLPFETQDYVAAITGQTAETFRNPKTQVKNFSLQKGKSFDESCPKLRVIKMRFKGGIAAAPRKPWGVQVAGHFSRKTALRSWTRVRRKLGVAIGNAKPQLHRQKTPRGMKSKWAVRIGANNRKKAIKICKKIQSVGGFCLVKKN